MPQRVCSNLYVAACVPAWRANVSACVYVAVHDMPTEHIHTHARAYNAALLFAPPPQLAFSSAMQLSHKTGHDMRSWSDFFKHMRRISGMHPKGSRRPLHRVRSVATVWREGRALRLAVPLGSMAAVWREWRALCLAVPPRAFPMVLNILKWCIRSPRVTA